MSQLTSIISQQGRFGYSGSSFPSQTVSLSEKETKEWQQANMNFMVQEARIQSRDKRRELQQWGMLSPDYTYKNHFWSIDPLGLGDKKEELYGATDPIKHYPIMNSPINTIVGERINRNIQFYCLSESPASFNEYHRSKTENLMEYVTGIIQKNAMSKVMKRAQQEGMQIDESVFGQLQEQAQQMSLPAIQAYADKEWIDVIEQSSNRLMRNMWKRNNLDEEFIEGFRTAVVTGKEFYSVHVMNNRIQIKHLNNFTVFFHKSPSSRWVSEGQYAGYRLFLTPSAVLDMYRDRLTVEDVDYIEKKLYPSDRSQGVNSLTGIKSIQWDTSIYADNQGNTWRDINTDAIDQMIEDFMITGTSTVRPSVSGLIEVVQAYWKSYRKVGLLHWYDELDNEQKDLVDENYTPDTDAGEWVKWYYINQVYQGTVIDEDLYLGIEPYPHQLFDIDDPDWSPLPIEGCYYSEIQGRPIGLIDLMQPWSELYDIIAYELKRDMKKAFGKVMYMSIDHIPNIPGFDQNKWMYWAKEFGIAWVGESKKRSQFSHYQAADMSFAEQINAKILLLDKMKINCDSFAGFSQMRLANSSMDDTATQSRLSQQNSVNQTEYYFWKHSQLIQRVLTLSLNIAKKLIPKDLQFLRNLYDDMEQKYLTTDAQLIRNSNIGLYIVHGFQANARKEVVRQAALSAAGKTGNAIDMADLILAETENEIKHTIRKIRTAADQATQAQRQHEQEIQDKINQDNAEERAWEREKHYSKLQSDERRTYMQSFLRQDNNLKDLDTDGTPDILEQSEHFEKVSDNMRKHERELSKIAANERIKNKELSLKEKELRIKQEALEVDRENMENDKEIAEINRKNRASKS